MADTNERRPLRFFAGIRLGALVSMSGDRPYRRAQSRGRGYSVVQIPVDFGLVLQG